MFRVLTCLALSVVLLACGPRPKPPTDAGMEEMDAGMEVDAGRPRGEDPANGWATAIELPTGALPSTTYASVSAIGDQYAQPMIAFLVVDPNGDLNFDDNRVVFSRWDGVTKTYQAPQTIEVVGGSAGLQAPFLRVSLALDAQTGRIGILYVKPQDNTVRLAVSDDEGVNFSLSTVSELTAAALFSPVLAMTAGVTHAAWIQGSDVKYRKREGSTGAWVDASPGAIVTGGRSLAMALDSAGAPALAFFVSVNATSADLAYWRPGSGANAIASADMLDLTPAEFSPSVSMTFVGTTPHLAYHLRKSAAGDATELWYLKGDGAGGWTTPVAIPRNSSSTTEFHSTRFYQAIAIEPSGRVSIAAPWSAVGTQTNCNGPKLSRSSDGASFVTCSPAGSPIQRGGDWVNLWTHKTGKQTLVFHYDARTNPSIKGGIVVWREP